jgi:hypothetical protein
MFIAEQMGKLTWSYLACGIAKEKESIIFSDRS